MITSFSIFADKHRIFSNRKILAVVVLYNLSLCSHSAVSFGIAKHTGLPITHVCTGYNHICHIDIILPGQE